MIDTDTVIVLGAGASAPYGFPIGSSLKDNIVKSLGNKVERDLYTSSGFSLTEIDEFHDVMITSPYSTIDAILSFRPSLARIGKFAIVKTLSVCQKHDKIFPPRDWYHTLFMRMGLEHINLPQPKLTVLTFNYDNSFEYFFERIIDRLYEGEQQAVIRKRFQAIDVIHLHGRLGPYPKENEDPLANLTHSIETADIKVISDSELDESKEFVRAHNALANANKIFFFGFGYADINLRRLRIKDIDGNPAMYGTCYQADPDDIKKIVGKNISLSSNSLNCQQALIHEWKNAI